MSSPISLNPPAKCMTNLARPSKGVEDLAADSEAIRMLERGTVHSRQHSQGGGEAPLLNGGISQICLAAINSEIGAAPLRRVKSNGSWWHRVAAGAWAALTTRVMHLGWVWIGVFYSRVLRRRLTDSQIRDANRKTVAVDLALAAACTLFRDAGRVPRGNTSDLCRARMTQPLSPLRRRGGGALPQRGGRESLKCGRRELTDEDEKEAPQKPNACILQWQIGLGVAGRRTQKTAWFGFGMLAICPWQETPAFGYSTRR